MTTGGGKQLTFRTVGAQRGHIARCAPPPNKKNCVRGVVCVTRGSLVATNFVMWWFCLEASFVQRYTPWLVRLNMYKWSDPIPRRQAGLSYGSGRHGQGLCSV